MLVKASTTQALDTSSALDAGLDSIKGDEGGHGRGAAKGTELLGIFGNESLVVRGHALCCVGITRERGHISTLGRITGY